MLLEPADGYARTVSDCVIESWDGESAIVVTGQPAAHDEKLVLQFNSPAGATSLYPACVVSCEMDPRHGPMRFRVQVQVTAATTEPGAGLDFPSKTHRGPVKR